MGPLDRNPTYVAGFVLLLALPQAGALAEQARSGYRPFAHAPVRVPLSWDMFSTAISRCDLAWDPPLMTGGGASHLGRLREAGTALEWDPVYDNVEDYTLAAQFGCFSAARVPTTVTLECFTFEGETVHRAFRCR